MIGSKRDHTRIIYYVNILFMCKSDNLWPLHSANTGTSGVGCVGPYLSVSAVCVHVG